MIESKANSAWFMCCNYQILMLINSLIMGLWSRNV